MPDNCADRLRRAASGSRPTATARRRPAAPTASGRSTPKARRAPRRSCSSACRSAPRCAARCFTPDDRDRLRRRAASGRRRRGLGGLRPPVLLRGPLDPLAGLQATACRRARRSSRSPSRAAARSASDHRQGSRGVREYGSRKSDLLLFHLSPIPLLPRQRRPERDQRHRGDRQHDADPPAGW